MEEEVNNMNTSNNGKKSGTSGVGTFFFLVVVVAVIVASLICGIFEFNYYVRAEINNLQTQINDLKKINLQMESNYNDALTINAGIEEEDTEDTTVETTNVVNADSTVSNEVDTNTTATNEVNADNTVSNEVANTVE